MPIYRIYTFDKGGHIRESAQLVECQNDEAAVNEAKQLCNGKVHEVWEKERCILRLDPRLDPAHR
jgi:hypothetical protein